MVTVTIGPVSYGLFTSDDRAFLADPTAELKLIDAMRKAHTMQVKGVSDRGLATVDTYSLEGLTPALAAVTRGCG